MNEPQGIGILSSLAGLIGSGSAAWATGWNVVTLFLVLSSAIVLVYTIKKKRR